MLSNLLENSFDAAKSYIKINIGYLNNQISVNIKNDYDGVLSNEEYGNYASTKSHASGLGLKRLKLILKKNNRFLKINDENGVFDVFATMKNSPAWLFWFAYAPALSFCKLWHFYASYVFGIEK